jgi:hypothetical protein
MLSVVIRSIMLSVVMPSVVITSIMLNTIMVSVNAGCFDYIHYAEYCYA